MKAKLTSSLASALFIFTSAAIAQAPQTGGISPAQMQQLQQLQERNAELEHEVTTLRAELQQRNKACELEQVIAQQRAAVEASKRAEQEQQAVEAQKRTSALQNIRTTPRFIQVWQQMLSERTKSDVVRLLGEPSKLRGPNSTLGANLDIWIYPGMVLREERGSDTWDLVISFNQQVVQQITAKARSK